MILLFTDFGHRGPYVGQMHAAILREWSHAQVVPVFNDLPPCNVKAAAFLLPAYVDDFPPGSVFLCVVDPGVGTERWPVVLRIGGSWFVGPDNGLFSVLAQRAETADAWRIRHEPTRLSASFHGRDLFAPVAALIARGGAVPGERVDVRELVRPDWPVDLAEIVYIDAFGNAMTGLRASMLDPRAQIRCGARSLPRARTFGDVQPGAAFWYENANGLVEIAVNQGSAARLLNLEVGTPVGL